MSLWRIKAEGEVANAEEHVDAVVLEDARAKMNATATAVVEREKSNAGDKTTMIYSDV